MTRRERLMATLNGRPVDRPAVSFYEIDGTLDVHSPDPFNIYTDPSWHPLIALAEEKTDLIARRGPAFVVAPQNELDTATETTVEYRNGSRITVRTTRIGSRVLSRRDRRDPDVNTVWHEEHLLKDVDDVEALLQLEPASAAGEIDTAPFERLEAEIGDRGIVMVDIADPLCRAASMFALDTFTIIAMTERQLFHRLLEWHQAFVQPFCERVAQALPGLLWRIVGPEYASEPYLPPQLFREYVTDYDRPMVDAIHRHRGFARIHSHGNLKNVLDHIAATGCMGLDPIEPPPQGDVSLSYVRRRYGAQMVLFGNLEASDIENLPTELFAENVKRAIAEGTEGDARGFVLMPSACPYGRRLSPLALANYECMVAQIEAL